MKKGKVDLKMSPLYDITNEMIKLEIKKKQYERFVNSPHRLKGHINKLAIDINTYKEAIHDILNNCSHKDDTLNQLKEVMKRKYPTISLEDLGNL